MLCYIANKEKYHSTVKYNGLRQENKFEKILLDILSLNIYATNNLNVAKALM